MSVSRLQEIFCFWVCIRGWLNGLCLFGQQNGYNWWFRCLLTSYEKLLDKNFCFFNQVSTRQDLLVTVFGAVVLHLSLVHYWKIKANCKLRDTVAYFDGVGIVFAARDSRTRCNGDQRCCWFYFPFFHSNLFSGKCAERKKKTYALSSSLFLLSLVATCYL